MIYKSSSSESTKTFAAKLAAKLVRRRSPSAKIVINHKHALVLALSGDLGSGKTTFVQGFMWGLGVRKRTTSPTFILFRRFAIRHSRFANIYHVDAYRIKKPKELLTLGFKEILSDPKNIVLIEWAENIRKVLPCGTIWVRFSHGKKHHERRIVV